ncbi:MAG: hypothetical protein ACREQ2_28550 [Candidatus Binatia bacterium]
MQYKGVSPLFSYEKLAELPLQLSQLFTVASFINSRLSMIAVDVRIDARSEHELAGTGYFLIIR